ncbi:hypothetical protein QBC46DRAFT_374410 [Diplogelasinospora grovesii]|uniref:Secreted protein n=1 Tax=Diplogelasinospora grovesii TaxID=303347 RepID=A0AAN6NFD8_9PEZI|nr:hypothetical protein QBC46DRAFT_374410 [Diplogelasinospora grovesii]
MLVARYIWVAFCTAFSTLCIKTILAICCPEFARGESKITCTYIVTRGEGYPKIATRLANPLSRAHDKWSLISVCVCCSCTNRIYELGAEVLFSQIALSLHH